MSPAESTQQSKSTGPRTSEGKAKSAINALRHGLTGRVVVLPSEDLKAYQTFCAELMTDLAPETPIERQYAQTFCDTQWRLNRARSYEDSMLTLGLFEDDDTADDHPEIHAALTAARVFRENSKAFANLSLYEQRLNRTLKESLRQLQELRTRRIAARQTALDEAAAIHNLNKMKGEPHEAVSGEPTPQFVFSTAEIETESRRQHARADAQKAKSVAFNLTNYQKFPMKQAA